MLDEQIESQRMKGETQGLGYTTYEKGNSSGTKDVMEEGKSAPKIQKTTSKKVQKPIYLIVLSQDTLLMFVETDLVLLMVIDLIPIKDINLEILICIATLATCMGKE